MKKRAKRRTSVADEAFDELARAIPGARHVVIPEAGHQPQVENPEPWTRALREHLEHARR